jgi:hypothetical protein
VVGCTHSENGKIVEAAGSLKKYQTRGGKDRDRGGRKILRTKRAPSGSVSSCVWCDPARCNAPVDASPLALADESANDRAILALHPRSGAVAKDVAPFIHPRLATVEQPVSGSPRKLIVEVIGGSPVGSTPEKAGRHGVQRRAAGRAIPIGRTLADRLEEAVSRRRCAARREGWI